MDQQLLFLINRDWTHPVLDRVMAGASSFDLWWPFIVLAAVAFAVVGGFRARAMLLVAGLAIGITDGLVVDSMKGWVGRPRPHDQLEGVRTLDLGKASPRFLAAFVPLQEGMSGSRIRPPGGNSFPSGHAANNFAFASVCIIFYRRWGWLALIPAVLVSYSRVYVGSHWPLDILVSALIGTGIGLLVAAAADALWRRWSPRIVPTWHERHPVLLRV